MRRTGHYRHPPPRPPPRPRVATRRRLRHRRPTSDPRGRPKVPTKPLADRGCTRPDAGRRRARNACRPALRLLGEVDQGGPKSFGGEFVSRRRWVCVREDVVDGSRAVIEEQVGALVADDRQLLAIGGTGRIEHHVGPVGRDAGTGDSAGGQPDIGNGLDDYPQARVEALEENFRRKSAAAESQPAQQRPRFQQRVHGGGSRCSVIRWASRIMSSRIRRPSGPSCSADRRATSISDAGACPAAAWSPVGSKK